MRQHEIQMVSSLGPPNTASYNSVTSSRTMSGWGRQYENGREQDHQGYLRTDVVVEADKCTTKLCKGGEVVSTHGP